MAWISALVAFMLMGIPTGRDARAQEVAHPLSAEARLVDFGITRADFVVRGRLAVDWRSNGPQLSVRWLRDVPAPPPSAVAGHVREEDRRPDGDSAARSEAGRLESALGSDPRPGEDGHPSGRHRALWVWETRRLLGDAQERAELLAFVRRRKIDRVYLNIPPAEGRRAAAGFVPFDATAFAPLVAGLWRAGAVVYALDGDPDYVLRANHSGVVRTVERVVAYNAEVADSARFRGVHYDVEPYLLRGFQGPEREEILESYLDLVEAIARTAHQGDLRVGLDVPFWLDAPDEETGRVPTAIHGGSRRTVLEHILSMVDEIAVMDYRTATSGPDGSVALVRGEIEAAASAGVEVYVGLETAPIADEDLYGFGASAPVSTPPSGGGPWIALEPREAGSVRIWLVPRGTVRSFRDQIAAEGSDPSALRYWKAGRAVHIPGDKLSFSRSDWATLEAAIRRIGERLHDETAFAGVALHHYGSLRALSEGR